MVTNTKQFNGQYGCLYCEKPGVSRAGAPGVRDWPPSDCALHSHDSLKNNAVEAVTTHEVVSL